MTYIEWFDLTVDIWISVIFPMFALRYLQIITFMAIKLEKIFNNNLKEIIVEKIREDEDGK